MYDASIATIVVDYAKFLRHSASRLEWSSKYQRFMPRIPRNAQLVVSCRYFDQYKRIYCGYYFVDHDKRTLLWIHDMQLKPYFKMNVPSMIIDIDSRRK